MPDKAVHLRLSCEKQAARWFDSFFAAYPRIPNDLHVGNATSLDENVPCVCVLVVCVGEWLCVVLLCVL